MTREIDEDERREAIDERRRRAWLSHCQCGGDMPGRCPGPANCPLCQPDPELCECCGEILDDGECAPCNAARKEGEAFVAEFGMPEGIEP